MYTNDNQSLNIDNANIRAAENNYASIDKLNADVNASEIGKFSRESSNEMNKRLENMDRINSASDGNANRTTQAKERLKDIQPSSFREVIREFVDKFKEKITTKLEAKDKISLAVAPRIRNIYDAERKDFATVLLQLKSRLSDKDRSMSRSAGNVRGNIKTASAGRG